MASHKMVWVCLLRKRGMVAKESKYMGGVTSHKLVWVCLSGEERMKPRITRMMRAESRPRGLGKKTENRAMSNDRKTYKEFL